MKYDSDTIINKGFIILFLMWLGFGVAVISLIKLSYRPGYGHVESTFQLAPESRMPGWSTLQAAYPRKDLSMTVTLYSASPGGNAQLIIYGPPPERKQLVERVGKYRRYPLPGQQKSDQYPYYAIIAIDGVEEIFEHRRNDGLLHIVDNPTVTSGLYQ